MLKEKNTYILKKVFLHIGRHKSGTTALQKFFQENSSFLERHGIYYPKSGRKNNVAHHELANILRPRSKRLKEAKKLKERFDKEVAPYDKILVSSEALQNIANLKLLKEFFDGYEIVVICYFREILDYQQSSYAQKVQASSYFGDFETYANNNNVNYFEFYKKWLKFSKRKLHVSYFNRQSLLKEDIVVDFLMHLGIDSLPIGYSSEKVNYSIGGNLLFFKLFLNLTNHQGAYNYKLLSNLASLNKRYHSGFFISDKYGEVIRKKNERNNLFIDKLIGQEISLKSFENRPLMPDLKFVEEDFALFTRKEDFGNILFLQKKLAQQN